MNEVTVEQLTNDLKAQQRQVRKDAGKCYRCFRVDPEPGKKRCRECAEKQRVYNRLYSRLHSGK